MLEVLLDMHDAADLPVRYAATPESLEGRMFKDLMEVCAQAASDGENNSTIVEIEDDGLLLDHDRAEAKWLKLRQDGNPDRLFMVRDPTTPDVVWFCCTQRDWLSFIVMMHRPRG